MLRVDNSTAPPQSVFQSCTIVHPQYVLEPLMLEALAPQHTVDSSRRLEDKFVGL